MKRMLWLVAAGVTTVTALAVAGSGPVAAEAADTPPSLVEDFTYPGADAIRTAPANFGLKLFNGDGHILFVRTRTYDDGQCPTGEIQVERALTTEPYGLYYCFRSIGTKGYLTLEVPATFGVRGGSNALEATAQLPDGEKTYQVPANTPVAISPGQGDELPPAILVELSLK